MADANRDQSAAAAAAAAAAAPAAAAAAGGAAGPGGPAFMQSILPALVAILGMGGSQAVDIAAKFRSMLAAGFRLPPTPPELAAELARLQPAMAAAMRPAFSPEMARYQRAVAALDPADPQFQQKLAQIPKPNIAALALPKISPDIGRKVREWLAPTPLGELLLEIERRNAQRGRPPPAQQTAPPPPQRAQQQQTSAAAGKPAGPPPKHSRKPQKPGAAPGPAAPAPAAPAASEDEPRGAGGIQEVDVVCNGLAGTFLVERQMMACYCSQCKSKAEREGLRRIVVSPSEYERHAGMGQAKKWKWTVHTADDKMTIGDWLMDKGLDMPRGRLGRSPYAAKKRKEQQQAEEEEASRALMVGPRSARVGRGKRKREGAEAGDGEEEEEEQEEEGEEGSPAADDRSPEPAHGGDRRSSTPATSGAPPAAAAVSAGGSGGMPAGAAAGGSDSMPAAASGGGSGGVPGGAAGAAAKEPDSPAAPAAVSAAGLGGGMKKHRQLRWIRRSETASPEPGARPEGDGTEAEEDYLTLQPKDEDMEEVEAEAERARGVGRTRSLAELQAGAEGAGQRQAPLPPLPAAAQRRPVAVLGPGGRPLPLLMPLQRAAEAAEAAAAAAERQAAAAGSAVGPRPLGPAPAATRRKGQLQQRDDVAEQLGQRNSSGKAWLQSDHAFHGEHEGSDMRLGDAYQARLPPYTGGPPTVLGPAGEAQEPMAALPGLPEAEALASAAGPEREQAMSLPRDATADVWLREVADHVRATITGRQQRQRKQSRWLQETFDPNAVLGGKPLVERQFAEDDAKDRFMLGRRAEGDVQLADDVEAAVAAGASPEVLRWEVERYQDGRLAVLVQLSIGGTLFSGTLVPTVGSSGAARSRPGAPAGGEAAAAGGGSGAVPAAAEAGPGRGLLPAVSGASLGSGRDVGDTPRALSLAVTGATGGGGPGPSNLGPGAAAAAAPGLGGPSHLEGESRPDADKAAEQRAAAERRAAAEARFQRMEVAGAPAGTKCSLCHGVTTDDIPETARGLGGRSQSGLGRMILVRVSAVAHAWVHDQCARWSPEVYDPEGNNRLEGMREAVRRGRMLRCKYCGNKGATLGCFKRTCRASYHLACARKYNCLLQVEPYLVACPEHVDDLPEPYTEALAKRTPGPQPGAARAAAAAGGGAARARGRASSRIRRKRGGDSDSRDEDEEADEESDSDDAEGGQAGSESERAAEQPGQGDAGRQRPEEKPRRQQQAQQAASGAAGPGSKQGKPDTSDLLKQLDALAGRLEKQQQQRKVAPPPPPPPPTGARLPLPLPIPIVPGAPQPVPVPWTRERIVEGPQLRAELSAEQALGTRVVVVNYEGEHFRFRAFHNAADVDAGVQADSDAILLLDPSLLPATSAWPHTHAFAELPKDRQVEAFANLLLKTFG